MILYSLEVSGTWCGAHMPTSGLGKYELYLIAREATIMLERLPTISGSTPVDYSTYLTLMITGVVNLQSSSITICNYILSAVKQF